MVKKIVIAISFLACATIARDDKVLMPLEKVLASEAFKEKVGDKIKFTFADTTLPVEAVSLGSTKTSQKTSRVGKKDSVACEWVFLSAMIALKNKAIQEKADAVMGIMSNYKNIEFPSSTSYECHVGAMMAGVALKGTLVKIAK